MKNTFIFTAILIFFVSQMQGQTYTLAFSTQAYSPLQNDTILSDTAWVGKLYPISLPFSVRISSGIIRSIFVSSDGQIMRKLTQGSFTSYRSLIYGFGNCGLRQKLGDTSQISFITEGETPNRITKIQFKNAGFVGDESHSDKINFQVWLHESGRLYELRFGPKTVVPIRAMNGAYGPFLGIGTQYMRGTPSLPQLGNLSYGMNGIPDSGMVYRFSRP